MKEISPEHFLLFMFISLVVSFFISYLYLTFYKNRATGSQIHRAFPLLGVSITALFISIQFSLPLSLGLLGALSIVRFRTPIKEPEEIGFIMLVVSASICCATGKLYFLGILLLVAYIGLIILNKGPRFFKGRLNDGILLVTMKNAEFKKNKSAVLNYLEEKLPKGKIESILENQDDSVLSYSFLHLDKETVIELQTELKEITTKLRSNIFFNRAGDI